MLSVKTKNQIVKEIQDLTISELEDAERFHKIKKRQKLEDLNSDRLLVMEKESQIDQLRGEISDLRRKIDKTKRSSEIVDTLLAELRKEKVSPIRKMDRIWNEFAEECPDLPVIGNNNINK